MSGVYNQNGGSAVKWWHGSHVLRYADWSDEERQVTGAYYKKIQNTTKTEEGGSCRWSLYRKDNAHHRATAKKIWTEPLLN